MDEILTNVTDYNLPDHDLLFEDIMPCPIDDHVTMGIMTEYSLSDLLNN